MKRGFTLVELLCVIIIISVVTLITVPIINKQIIASRDALYKDQIIDIEEAAKKFITEKNELADPTHINDIYVSLATIQQLGYLEKGDILDPKTKKKMEGCILISYDDKASGYNYTYNENSCLDYASSNDAYIIYDYDKNSNDVVKNEDNKKISAADYIINEYANKATDGGSINLLKVEGQTDSGLYDIDDEYVFRGSNVNNYVKYNGSDNGSDNGSEYRILSIDKETKTMKIISTTGYASLFGDSTIFNSTAYYTESKKEYSKISLNKNWDTGIVLNNDKSRNIVKQEVKNTNNDESILKFGLISVYDYINASTDDNCYNNFKSDGCGNNNYLKDMFDMYDDNKSAWTLTRLNDTDIWYVDSNGTLKTTNAITGGNTFRKYDVLTLDSTVYISNAGLSTGSKDFPFELK